MPVSNGRRPTMTVIQTDEIPASIIRYWNSPLRQEWGQPLIRLDYVVVLVVFGKRQQDAHTASHPTYDRVIKCKLRLKRGPSMTALNALFVVIGEGDAQRVFYLGEARRLNRWMAVLPYVVLPFQSSSPLCSSRGPRICF